MMRFRNDCGCLAQGMLVIDAELFNTLSSLKPPHSCKRIARADAAWGLCFLPGGETADPPRRESEILNFGSRFAAARGMTVANKETCRESIRAGGDFMGLL
jgi:hypothetical protein